MSAIVEIMMRFAKMFNFRILLDNDYKREEKKKKQKIIINKICLKKMISSHTPC
jgi:hypothetical protein